MNNLIGKRCSYCGQPATYGERGIYTCDESECSIEWERDERDRNQQEYESAIDDVNERFGRSW